MSDNYYQSVQDTANFLKKEGIKASSIGIVLGTGLSRFIEHIEIEKEIAYEKIPGFSPATVEFHSGKLIYGKVNGKNVLAMNGRYHYYEGYSMKEITFPIRVMKLLGVQHLLLSNAAGAMNLEWKKGDLMLISDHINLQPSNPLIGKNIEEFGPRFPDMSNAYDKSLRIQMNSIAKRQSIVLHEGVYVSVPGSMLESPAEYRFLRRIGADAVGMSTVPEVITAVHMGMKVVAVSVLTDECDPDNLKPINIAEIIEIAGKSEQKLGVIFKEIINEIK